MTAYTASSNLAGERGSFPGYNADKFLNSGFMKTMPSQIRDIIRKQGIRNVSIMTQAPTGSTGSMVNTSTGIEPYYHLSYERTIRLGTFPETVYSL